MLVDDAVDDWPLAVEVADSFAGVAVRADSDWFAEEDAIVESDDLESC